MLKAREALTRNTTYKWAENFLDEVVAPAIRCSAPYQTYVNLPYTRSKNGRIVFEGIECTDAEKCSEIVLHLLNELGYEFELIHDQNYIPIMWGDAYEYED